MKKWVNVALVGLLCVSPVDLLAGKELITYAVEAGTISQAGARFFVGKSIVYTLGKDKTITEMPRFFKEGNKTDITFDTWEIRGDQQGQDFEATFKPVKSFKVVSPEKRTEGQRVVSFYIGKELYQQKVLKVSDPLDVAQFPKLTSNLKGVLFDKWQVKKNETASEGDVSYEAVFKFDKKKFPDENQPLVDVPGTDEEETDTSTAESESESESETKESEVSKETQTETTEIAKETETDKETETEADKETETDKETESDKETEKTKTSDDSADKKTKADQDYKWPEIIDKGWKRDPADDGWKSIPSTNKGSTMSKYVITKGQNEETGDKGLEYHYNFGGQAFQIGVNKDVPLSDIPAAMTGLFIKDLNTNQIIDSLYTSQGKINNSSSGLYVHFYKDAKDPGPSETIHTVMLDSDFYVRTSEYEGKNITSLMAESKLVGTKMNQNEEAASGTSVKEKQKIPTQPGFKTPTGTAINETSTSDLANLKVRSMISPDEKGRIHMAFALLNDGDKPITLQVSRSQDTALGGNDKVPITTIEDKENPGKSMNGAAIEDNGYRLEFDFSSKTGPEAWLPRYDSLWRTPGLGEFTGLAVKDDTGKATGIVRSPVTKDTTNTPFPSGGAVIDKIGDGARIFYGYGNNKGIGDSRGAGTEAFVKNGLIKTDPEGNKRDYGKSGTEFPRIGRSYSGISYFDLDNPNAYQTGDTGFQERWGVKTIQPGETYNGEYIINMESVHTNELEYRNITQQGEGDYPQAKKAKSPQKTSTTGRTERETNNTINFKGDVIRAKNTVKLSPDMYKKASESGQAIYLKNQAERPEVNGVETRMLQIKMDADHPIKMLVTKPDGAVSEFNLAEHLTAEEIAFINKNGYIDYAIGKNVPDGKDDNREDQLGLQYETYYYADVIYEHKADVLLKSASRVSKYEGLNARAVETGTTASGSVLVPIGNASGLDVKITGVPEFATSLGRLPKYVLAGKGTGIVMDVTPSGDYANKEYNWELSLKSGEVTATDTIIDPNNPDGDITRDNSLPALSMDKVKMVIGGKFDNGKVVGGVPLSDKSQKIMSRNQLTDLKDPNNSLNEETGEITNNFGVINAKTGKYHGEFGGKAGNLVLSVGKDSIDWGNNYALRQLLFPLEWSIEMKKENGDKVEKSPAVLPKG